MASDQCGALGRFFDHQGRGIAGAFLIGGRGVLHPLTVAPVPKAVCARRATAAIWRPK